MALRAVNSGGPAQEDSEGNSGSNWARDSSCDFGKHVSASCMLCPLSLASASGVLLRCALGLHLLHGTPM